MLIIQWDNLADVKNINTYTIIAEKKVIPVKNCETTKKHQ